jgi:hypothetical protein
MKPVNLQELLREYYDTVFTRNWSYIDWGGLETLFTILDTYSCYTIEGANGVHILKGPGGRTFIPYIGDWDRKVCVCREVRFPHVICRKVTAREQDWPKWHISKNS